ncbi:MAG: GntR family transcriptional regulator [Desulfovibrionales bacterium]|nr:GntR family transcriptional regulator [Desulfovibrionales bacterium]
MLTKKEPNTRVERAVQELERMIFSGDLTSGEHIKESEIGDKLSLSRGVVREAFTSLAQAGLVEIIPHRGGFVRSFTVKETLDFFDLRAHLALYAVKEAALNITRRELAELVDILDRLDVAVHDADPTEMMNLNCQFHQRIFEKCENTALVAFAKDIRLKQFLSCRHTFRVATTGVEAGREHRAILEGLADGDGERAATMMHDHIMQGKRRFLEAIAHKE